MAGVENRILSFDRGIEGVLPPQGQDVALPQSSQLVPWDGRVEEKVHQLLLAPSREDQLLQMLAPDDITPDTLTPGLFRGLIHSGMSWLREHSDKQEAFAQALNVLEDLDSATRLLEAYRNALHQA